MTRSHKILSILLALALAAAGCASPPKQTPAPTETRPAQVSTPEATDKAAPSATPGRPSATPNAGAAIHCMDGALFVQDLSVPDGTDLAPGQAFTKTWRLRNTGTCTWDPGYQLVFASGDQLGAPDSVPLALTPPGETLDLSVAMTAPAGRGAFTALFEIHTPRGEVLPVGQLQNVWAKITVGGGPDLSPAGQTAVAGTPLPTKTGRSGKCQYNENAGYVQQLAGLINAARKDAKLRPYNWDSRLADAAQAHSLDMGCHNFLKHTGSDGSWIGDRLAKAGYSTYHYSEIIAVGTPQDAMAQWRADPAHWDSVLDASLVDFGIGYVYVAGSNYGGYFTVDIAKP